MLGRLGPSWPRVLRVQPQGVLVVVALVGRVAVLAVDVVHVVAVLDGRVAAALAVGVVVAAVDDVVTTAA